MTSILSSTLKVLFVSASRDKIWISAQYRGFFREIFIRESMTCLFVINKEILWLKWKPHIYFSTQLLFSITACTGLRSLYALSVYPEFVSSFFQCFIWAFDELADKEGYAMFAMFLHFFINFSISQWRSQSPIQLRKLSFFLLSLCKFIWTWVL